MYFQYLKTWGYTCTRWLLDRNLVPVKIWMQHKTINQNGLGTAYYVPIHQTSWCCNAFISLKTFLKEELKQLQFYESFTVHEKAPFSPCVYLWASLDKMDMKLILLLTNIRLCLDDYNKEVRRSHITSINWNMDEYCGRFWLECVWKNDTLNFSQIQNYNGLAIPLKSILESKLPTVAITHFKLLFGGRDKTWPLSLTEENVTIIK
jgi:hypothetical protein